MDFIFRCRLVCVFVVLVFFGKANAQQDKMQDSLGVQREILDSIRRKNRLVDSIAINVHLQAHVSYFSNTFELGENVPRFGTSFFRNVGKKTRVFARLEYGLNLAQGTRFNNNANSKAEFASSPFQVPDPFTQRLAFLGIEHRELGSISFGKQWGAYYDIAGFTDAFTVFGSSGVDVYAGNTDGGWKGTGRADVAVVYRNNFRKLYFSLQTQLFGTNTNYGAAVNYRFNRNWNVGVGWNMANIPSRFIEVLGNDKASSHNLIIGYQYQDSRLYSALTMAYIEDVYRVIEEDNIISFPVYGVEFLNRYTLTPRIKIEGGLNAQWEIKDDTYYNGDYRLLQFYAGMNYYFGELFSVYIQGRLNDSRFLPPRASSDVIIVGMSFDFIKGLF
ncbi:porin [Robertkochia marina]|uniref:Porin n=1 Tax=Robertkochia marina TaxID=1227945 RepID=A0A4S3M4I0_9FLAO|nr:porin [Robertkochia marina]THD69725.1 porin [Robertkochia marina]TRZ46932.1 porin [Robertkochia marina]